MYTTNFGLGLENKKFSPMMFIQFFLTFRVDNVSVNFRLENAKKHVFFFLANFNH